MRAGPALALGAALLALAACSRPAEKTAAETPAEPAEAPAASASAAPAAPPVPEGKFEAISNTAMGVTGDLEAAGGTFRFAQGQSYGLTGEAGLKASAPYASTKASFASLINVPDTADLSVLKVASEDKGKARNGGFCGAEAATYLVTHQGVDGGGAPAFFIMAFKGAAPPSAASAETDLCGTFMYGPKAG